MGKKKSAWLHRGGPGSEEPIDLELSGSATLGETARRG